MHQAKTTANTPADFNLTRLRADGVFEAGKAAFILLALWAIVFLGHNWEIGQKLDAMTNSVLAKNILRTGDWFTLHYSEQSFPDYYAHPPLPIWVEAILFKIFGISDFTARLGPALFGLGTLSGVFYLGLRMGGVFSGFLSCLVLLTTSRYFKYAADAFLEGPLACLMIWGAVCQFDFFRKFKKVSRFSMIGSLPAILFGVFTALGFLTKSVFCFSLPLCSLLYFGLSKAQFRGVGGNSSDKPDLHSMRVFVVMAAVGFSSVIFPWLVAGRGIEFLQGHWGEIGGRVQEHPSLEQRLVPILNLVKTYWPWLPLWIYSNFILVKNWVKAPGELIFVTLFAWVQLLGLTYSGFYFEHYMVPFYPMASLGIGYYLSRLVLTWGESWKRRIYQGVEKGALVMALVLAIFPLRLHSLHSEPIEGLLQHMERSCSGATQVLVSQKVMEKWMALAVVLWRTPWDAVSVNFEETFDAGKNQLFILRASELEHATPGWYGQWKRVAVDGELLLFESRRGGVVCKE